MNHHSSDGSMQCSSQLQAVAGIFQADCTELLQSLPILEMLGALLTNLR